MPQGAAARAGHPGAFGHASRRVHAVLPVCSLAAYDPAMDDVTLPPELERFAAEAIAAGRYRDMAHVVRTGVGLVQQLEAERAGFLTALQEAEAEADRVGRVSLEQADAGMRDAIRAAARRSA